MMTHIQSARTHPTTRQIRTVAVVGSPPQRVFDGLLRTVDHDVVYVASSARAYSHIKHATPDLVIVCLAGDDVDGCRVLSMLALDSETSRIPVLTYVTPPPDAFTTEDAERDPDGFSCIGPSSLN